MKKQTINKAKREIKKAADRLKKRQWETAPLREALENVIRLYDEWIDEDPIRWSNDEAAMFRESLYDWTAGETDDTIEATLQAIQDAYNIIWHFDNN